MTTKNINYLLLNQDNELNIDGYSNSRNNKNIFSKYFIRTFNDIDSLLEKKEICEKEDKNISDSSNSCLSKAERDAKAEREARKKAEREARKKAEREASVRAELEARKKAELEASVKAELEAKKKAELEASVRAETPKKLSILPNKIRSPKIDSSKAALATSATLVTRTTRVRAESPKKLSILPNKIRSPRLPKSLSGPKKGPKKGTKKSRKSGKRKSGKRKSGKRKSGKKPRNQKVKEEFSNTDSIVRETFNVVNHRLDKDTLKATVRLINNKINSMVDDIESIPQPLHKNYKFFLDRLKYLIKNKQLFIKFVINVTADDNLINLLQVENFDNDSYNNIDNIIENKLLETFAKDDYKRKSVPIENFNELNGKNVFIYFIIGIILYMFYRNWKK